MTELEFKTLFTIHEKNETDDFSEIKTDNVPVTLDIQFKLWP